MHDYSPLAVLAFAALAIVAVVALMFVLAWLESTLPNEEPVLARAADSVPAMPRIRLKPPSWTPDPRPESIMKVGRHGLATR